MYYLRLIKRSVEYALMLFVFKLIMLEEYLSGSHSHRSALPPVSEPLLQVLTLHQELPLYLLFSLDLLMQEYLVFFYTLLRGGRVAVIILLLNLVNLLLNLVFFNLGENF